MVSKYKTRLIFIVLFSIFLRISWGYPNYCTIEDGFYYKEHVRIIFMDGEVVNEQEGDCNFPKLYNATKHVIDTWESGLTELY